MNFNMDHNLLWLSCSLWISPETTDFIYPCLHTPTVYLCFSPVLTAAVTQASLQSMLHKILTAGPSAFNITTILSQAAQLSNQGKQNHCAVTSVPPLCSTTVGLTDFPAPHLALKENSKLDWNHNCVWFLRLSFWFCIPSSSAIEPVTYVVNIGRLIAQVLCFPEDQHAADKRRPP